MEEGEFISTDTNGDSLGGKVPLRVYFLGVLLVLGVLFFLLESTSRTGRRQTGDAIAVKVQLVSLGDLRSIYDSNQGKSGFVVLDLRKSVAWEEQNIPGSIHFTPTNLEKYNNVRKIDRFTKIALVAEDVTEVQDFASCLKTKEWESSKEIYVLSVPVSKWFMAGYPEAQFEI